MKLHPYAVHQFEWGTAFKHRCGRWEKIIFPDGQEINVSRMSIIVHENGIEFI